MKFNKYKIIEQKGLEKTKQRYFGQKQLLKYPNNDFGCLIFMKKILIMLLNGLEYLKKFNLLKMEHKFY